MSVAGLTFAASPAAQPTTLSSSRSNAILDAARQRAASVGLPFAGGVAPADAWALFSKGLATLVDVRSAEERKFVGHVPGSLHVPWATGTSLARNPRFVRELEGKTGKEAALLLGWPEGTVTGRLCRARALLADRLTRRGFRLIAARGASPLGQRAAALPVGGGSPTSGR